MSNLTTIQKIAITMAVLGVLSTSGVQLTDILGPAISKTTVSVAGLINSVLAAIVAVLSGQGAIVKQVAAMPGVSRISVNENANPVLAQLATASDQPGIGATDPATREVLKETAKGNTP